MDFFTFDFSSRRLKRFDYLIQAIAEAKKNPKQTVIIEGKQLMIEQFGTYIISEKIKTE